ncbi:hypothetical protein IHE45_14G035800 [Dioscorea alata]|uniref:Uncharacterized protein n=1 Tax=Dioscorea alata TaxID=55571 RepID=A0ACB7UR31_DIOAL|nr:hypothetical protein IHE45_14G035800 [Dioscorea alata]
MVPASRCYSSSQSSASILSGFFGCKAFRIPCCANRSFTLVCHNPKLPVPSNFTTSNFAPDIAISTTLWYQLLRKNKANKHKNKEDKDLTRFNELFQELSKCSTTTNQHEL